MRNPLPKNSLFVLAVLGTSLSGCSSFSDIPDVTSMLSPYRIDVRQGNYLNQDMVAKLRAGQSREQVRFILGSPLIEDAFHSDRWDYVYRFKPGSGESTERHFAVYFDGDKLVRVSGDVIPDSAEAAAADAKAAEKRTKVIEIGGAARAQAATEAVAEKK